MAEARALGLAGAPNARDLGGLPTAAGGYVRPGLLMRTGALGRLTDADVSRLGELKPACVLDLRGEPEVAEGPPNRLPHPAPQVHHLPVHDAQHQVFTYVAALLQGHDLSSYARLTEQGTPAAMAEIYRWFVTGGAARESFAAACRVLAEPGSLPAVFHCSVGKDRTGWLVVILLTLLGVDPEAIRADYLYTNRATAAAQERLLARLSQRGVDLAGVRPLLQARDTYLDAAYAEVARVHGSFDGYLRDGLGLTEDTLAALRTLSVSSG